MDETTTTTPTTETGTETKKAIDYETMAALAPKLATKTHVQNAIAGALLAGINFATKDEVLALFEEEPSAGNAS